MQPAHSLKVWYNEKLVLFTSQIGFLCATMDTLMMLWAEESRRIFVTLQLALG